MAELRIPEPSEKQCLFMADRHKYIGYGGARGGGKSWAVRVKAVLLCLRYAGIKVMIIRKTYPELQENHIIPLCEMLGCYADGKERIASYNDGKKHIVFPNGSRILFRYCDNDKDALRFQGTEVDVLFVDEATQQSEEKMEKLRACVRGVNDFPKRVYYTCNPGGEGHAWVKRLFIDRRFKEGEEPEEHSFIQSLITDNTALMEADPQYIKQLEALPPKLRDAWLYGNWEIFEGQFFEDFRTEPDMRAAAEHGESLTADELRAQRRWVHVIEPFDLSSGSCRGWRIMRSYDFGYGKPFSCAWWAIDYDGVIYRILELYGCTGHAERGREMDAGSAVCGDCTHRAGAPVAAGEEDRGSGRPRNMGREPWREHCGHGGALRAVLHEGRQRENTGVDAVPLQAPVRRGGLQQDVRILKLRGIYKNSARDDVQQDGTGGSRHGDGGSRLRRVEIHVHVAPGGTAETGGEENNDE